jgi:hypothetical protein
MEAVVLGWSAWAPGLEDRSSWERWAEKPAPLGLEGVPDAKFLPAMLRRRCTPLTKIMLRVAFDACPETDRDRVRTVFASRHGSINESIDLIEAVVRSERLSPAKFSHTVHNAQAALFSIAALNRQASASLAGQADTFPLGFLEALTHLEREPERQVLFVTGDVPLAPTFAPLVSEPTASYAVGLRLARAGAGPRVDFDLESGAGDPAASWPQAAEFLHWWIAGAGALRMEGARQQFRWRRL